MATTARIAITYLVEGQRQKEVSINSAYDIIDNKIQTDLGEFTLATLPSAASNKNGWIVVTDSTPPRALCRSDGTNWKTFSDGTNIIREGATVA